MFVVCIYIFSDYFVHFIILPMLILVPYSVDPDQLASQRLADLDLHSYGIVMIRQCPKFLLICFCRILCA